ncbi:MAG: hypothetical protein WC593_12150 [Methanoregula sp.]
MKRLVHLLNLLIDKKISLKNPKKSDVLIWDAENIDILSIHTLYGIDHTILPVRGEVVYYSPQIIIKILKIFISSIFNNLLSREEMIDTGQSSVHSLACIQYINPKVVLTFNDNNATFYWLSSKFPQATFYAIQNGNRVFNDTLEYSPYDLERDELALSFMNKLNPSTHLIVYGEHEISFYKKNHACIGTYYPIGSLKGSHYRYKVIGHLPKNEFTLCLVSPYRKALMEGLLFPNLKQSMVIIIDYINQFIQETGSRLCIALASETQEEYDYFLNKFGNEITIIKQNRELFSTYEAMSKSEVILSTHSTAVIEAFGWGKKVLFCNYSGDPFLDHTFSDICNTNIIDYTCFKNKLQFLLDMDAGLYSDMTRNAQKHMMNYNPDIPATLFLRKLVLQDLTPPNKSNILTK